MYSPMVNERVRVQGREGESLAFRVAAASSAADVGNSALPTPIKQEILSPPSSPVLTEEALQGDERDGINRIARSRAILLSSHAHWMQSLFMIADMRDLIRSTLEVIRASQQRIAESDRLIARAQTMGDGRS